MRLQAWAGMTANLSGLKRQAGEHAAALVQSGMVCDLGSGSTATFATRRIAEWLCTGDLKDFVAIATSRATGTAARELGIPMLAGDIPCDIDITIDGADEMEPSLNLIKGGGGALLREKIIAQATRREVIVVDESKLSPGLGSHWALPVEALEFGWRSQVRFLECLGAVVTPRISAGDLFRTDQRNMILDSGFGPIADPSSLAADLSLRAGIVAHGLFIGLVHDLLVAGASGVRHVRRHGLEPVSSSDFWPRQLDAVATIPVATALGSRCRGNRLRTACQPPRE